MKLLQLTDFYDKQSAEYLVVEKVRHIQKHSQEFMNIKSEEQEVTSTPGFLGRLFGEKPKTTTETVEISREKVTRTGSCVFFDDGHTIVLESPEEIARLLVDGSKTTEVKG
jgi:hypothetical protein